MINYLNLTFKSAWMQSIFLKIFNLFFVILLINKYYTRRWNWIITAEGESRELVPQRVKGIHSPTTLLPFLTPPKKDAENSLRKQSRSVRRPPKPTVSFPISAFTPPHPKFTPNQSTTQSNIEVVFLGRNPILKLLLHIEREKKES